MSGGSGTRPPRVLPHFDPRVSARFGMEVLTEANVPFALIGRVAMWALLPESEHDFTKDVDFAVPLSASAAIRAVLARRGESVRDLPIGGVAVRNDDVRVDFIDRREGGLHRLFEEAIDEARGSGERADVGGASVPVVTPEYLVAMKVVAADDKDQMDAVRLLKALPALDLARARDILQRHGGPGSANLLDNLARRAGRPDARPEYRNGG